MGWEVGGRVGIDRRMCGVGGRGESGDRQEV